MLLDSIYEGGEYTRTVQTLQKGPILLYSLAIKKVLQAFPFSISLAPRHSSQNICSYSLHRTPWLRVPKVSDGYGYALADYHLLHK